MEQINTLRVKQILDGKQGTPQAKYSASISSTHDLPQYKSINGYKSANNSILIYGYMMLGFKTAEQARKMAYKIAKEINISIDQEL